MSLKRRTWQIVTPAEPGDQLSRQFDIFLVTLIALNVVAVILETVAAIRLRFATIFFLFEVFSVAVFSIEYLARLWSITANPRFQRPLLGRLRWVITPMAIVDLLAVVPAYLPFLGIDLRFLRALRLMRIFRLVKISRYVGALQLLGQVVREKREELILTTFIVGLLLILASSLMYYAEHTVQPDAFSSIPETMWWAIATLTTVGYGDVYPITGLGRVLGGVVALLGVGLIALPTAILGSGFVDAVERRRRERGEDLPAASRRCPHCGEVIE